MPTCSQAKILTNLEYGIQRRISKQTDHGFIDLHEAGNTGPVEIQMHEYYNTDKDGQSMYNYDQKGAMNIDGFKTVHIVSKKLGKLDNCPPIRNDHSSSIQSQFMEPRKQKSIYDPHFNTKTHRTRGLNRAPQRRISIDELQTNPFEPNQQKVLHKIPIVFDENLKKSSYHNVPSYLFANTHKSNSHQQSLNSLVSQHKFNQLRNSKQSGSDGEDEESSGYSDDYNSSEKSSADFSLSGRRGSNPKIKSNRRSIDYGQFKKMSAEDSKIYLAAKSQEIIRRNSLLNQNQNVLSTNFPKIALEVESIDDDMLTLDDRTNQLLNKSTNTFKSVRLDTKREHNSMNAKRLLALASIRPSVTFHKSMTSEEISILKKYYEILKPKAPAQSESVNKEEEPQPTLMYDTAKINFSNLQNLKNFLETHKKSIESGSSVIDYDVNNDGAPSGFILKSQDDDIIAKFPAEINDAFFAFTVMNETADKIETRLSEANLFRVLNWNDTSALSNTMISKKPSVQTKILPNSLQSSATTSLTSTSSSPSNSTAELSFEYIKNLSSLVSTMVSPNLSKQLKRNSIDISTLPGSASSDIPSFEEMGINLPNLISEPNSNNGEPNPPSEIQSSKLKVTAYKNLKEKVGATRTMWFNGPPERKPMSVIFEYGDDEFGHEKILEEVNKSIQNSKGHVISLEFVPRSVHFGSVYVDNQWILTLNNQTAKFYTITNGIKINDEHIEVQSYDEFIFTEFEKFIRVEKYKQLIKNHEKAVQLNNKKYAK